MPIDTARTVAPRYPENVVAEQKRRAAKEAARETATAAAAKSAAAPSVPATTATSTPATLVTDARTPEQVYIDAIAPSMIAGTLVKFSKEGLFVVAETEEEVSPDTDFIALCDETLIGWIKFGGDGEPPTRHQGLLYGGFAMPSREVLGDGDPDQWPAGPSGAPEDPWKHQICLVLQEPKTQALYTFVTTSQTGRRAVGNLLRHFDRLQRTDKDSYPLVRLKPSGFFHKDKAVGFVHTPSFQIMGRVPKNAAAVPDSSVAADLNDEIPGF